MRPLTPWRFILKRLRSDWALLLIAFVGVIVATSLISGTPIYLRTLERLGLNDAIDRTPPSTLNVYTSGRNVPLTREDIDRAEDSAEKAFLNNIPEIYRGHDRALRTNPHLFDPTQAVPEPELALVLSSEQAAEEAKVEGSLAYFTNILGIRDRLRVVEGRLAGHGLEKDPDKYPRIVGTVEVVIGAPVARVHGLQVGDVLTLATSTNARDWTRASARIVGMVEAINPSAEFWQGSTDVFFNPPTLQHVPDVGVEIDPSLPPVALIITTEAAAGLPGELVEVSRRTRFQAVDGRRGTIIPEPKVMMALSEEQSLRQEKIAGSLGYLIHLEDLADHVSFSEGRMAEGTISANLEGHPGVDRVVEAIVGLQVAKRHDLHVGELLTVTPSAQFSSRIAARIVGIVDVTDTSEEYWQGRSNAFFDPPVPESVPDLGVEVDPGRPPVVLIITPEAAGKLSTDLVAPPSYDSQFAVFATLTDMDEHLSVAIGRMPNDTVRSGPQGPIIEAVLTSPLGLIYGVDMGDEVLVTPYVDDPVRVTAVIVGIVMRNDPLTEYWESAFAGFFEPPPPPPPPPAPEPPPPPMPLLVKENILVETIGAAYGNSQANVDWLTYVDKEELKRLSISDAKLQLDDLDNEISDAVPVHQTFSGIGTMLIEFERRIFLAMVPLLLLLATMVVAVLYFLSMMVAYLVRSRESDLAGLKTRGVGMLQVVRLYGTEGLVVTVLAVVTAPFIAIGATALAGTLPYFRDLTGGELLPVQWTLLPFLVALGAGVLCLFLLLAPAVLSARTSQLAHRLRSSRPPSVPFFHRYHLDIGLLLVGGLIFWELQSREELLVGGVFRDAQINETLLLAPVLFLTVVALVFIRFFPLVLRFVSGESAALLHVLFAATAVPLGIAVAVRETIDGNGLAWWAPVATLAALFVSYWGTQRLGGGWVRAVGLILQGLLVWLFVIQEPPVLGTLNVVSTAILASLVPLQLAFLLFRGLSRRSPAWVSLALWSMTRNPLQYTWLVLLLVLVTGLATFATTVGATLDRKDEERIRYGVAADMRVTGARELDGWALREQYLTVPGVSSVSPAFRAAGTSLPDVSLSYRALGVQSEIFAAMSWYRDDFSTRPLGQLMNGLRTEKATDGLVLPSDATSVGLWAKLTPASTALNLQMVLMDGSGDLRVVRFGRLLMRDWYLMSADLPTPLEPPVHLVSVRVRPSSGIVTSSGSVLLDDIHVNLGNNGESIVLDDFEQRNGWTALPTSLNASESVFKMSDDSHGGRGAGSYTYGTAATGGVPGIYLSPTGGPLPVVVSSTVMGHYEDRVGTPFIGTINNRLVSMVVADTVEYFPTMDPSDGGFVVADLELLFAHLRVANVGTVFTPNEFFFALEPESGPNTLIEVQRMTPRPAVLLHGEAMRQIMVASIGLDPLVTAGWRAMALLSIAIVLFAGGTGYVTYLLFFAERNGGDMDVLRSLGLQQRQVIGLLSLEHLVIVLVGIGLGIWAGLRMSVLTVPSVSLPEAGGTVLPPILVTADWWILGAVCIALVLGFVQMVLLLKRRIFRTDLEGVSRRLEI